MDRSNIQHKNVHQSNIKQTGKDQSVEQMVSTDGHIFNLNQSLKQLKLFIRLTSKQRIIIVVARKVTTQVRRLFLRKRILLSLVIA